MQKIKWKKAPPELTALITEKMKYFECEKRSMFGYPCFFVNRNMFCGLFADRVFLRIPEADRMMLLKAEGIKPFEPLKGRVMKEYIELPFELFEKEGWFKKWVVKSFEYTRTLPVKAKKKKAAAIKPQR
jgi:TfoX/Sxy family transcriptional regulator of competence genes